MPFDFSSYQVAAGEKPASSAKFNNFLQAVQAGMNAFPAANIVGFPSDAGRFLNGAGGWSIPITDMAAIYVKTSSTEIVNNASALDLFGDAITIAAGKMGPNSAIKIWAGGEYLNNVNTTRNLRLALQLGPSTLWDSGASDNTQQNNNKCAWHFQAVIQNLGSVASQTGSGLFEMSTPSLPAVGLGKLNNAISLYGAFSDVVTAVNMAGSQPLKLIAQHNSAATLLSIKCIYARVEVTA